MRCCLASLQCGVEFRCFRAWGRFKCQGLSHVHTIPAQQAASASNKHTPVLSITRESMQGEQQSEFVCTGSNFQPKSPMKSGNVYIIWFECCCRRDGFGILQLKHAHASSDIQHELPSVCFHKPATYLHRAILGAYLKAALGVLKTASGYLRDRRPCTVPEVGMTDVPLVAPAVMS